MKLITLVLLILGLSVRAWADEAVFIVNPSVTESAISTDDMKNILLGNKTKWDSGNLKLIVLTEGAVHEKVVRDYTQRSPDQFEKYWKKLLFTGKGSMPAQAKDDAEVLDYVAKNPGALGYIAKPTAADRVKVLTVK